MRWRHVQYSNMGVLMKYFEIRRDDMTVIGEIETADGDVIACRAGNFMLGEPAVTVMVQAGGYATKQEAFEAGGYVWDVSDGQE
jgi:hypothetical protein